jgi:hypothetical protein
MVPEIPKFYNVKTGLCQERPKSWGAERHSEDTSTIVFFFSEEDLLLTNNCVCL